MADKNNKIVIKMGNIILSNISNKITQKKSKRQKTDHSPYNGNYNTIQQNSRRAQLALPGQIHAKPQTSENSGQKVKRGADQQNQDLLIHDSVGDLQPKPQIHVGAMSSKPGKAAKLYTPIKRSVRHKT